MREHGRNAIRRASVVLSLIVCWELLSLVFQRGPTITNSFPPPSAVIEYLLFHWLLFLEASAHTMLYAIVALALGSICGLLLASVFTLFSQYSSWLQGFVLCVFSAPIAAIALLVAPAVDDGIPGLIIGSLLVCHPMLVVFGRALLCVSKHAKEFIQGSGGCNIELFRLLRVPSAIPAALHGLRLGVVGALLGVMIGEFGKGDKGLGHLLRGAVVATEPRQQWSIVFISVGLASIGFALIGLAKRKLDARGYKVTLDAISAAADLDTSNFGRKADRIKIALKRSFVQLLVAAFLWHILANMFGWPDVLNAGRSLVLLGNDGEGLARLLGDILTACGIAVLSIAISAIAGYSLAMAFFLFPNSRQAIMPLILVFQVTPMIAFVPVIVLVLGHSFAAILCIGISSVFYRIFEVIDHSFVQIPEDLTGVFGVSGASQEDKLFHLIIPASRSSVATSLRAGFPMAIQGVILGQFITSYSGLGGFMQRSISHPSLIWAACVAAILIAFLMHEVASALEQAFLRDSSIGYHEIS